MKLRYIFWIISIAVIGLVTAREFARGDTSLWGSFDASSGTEDASIWGATTRWEAQSFTTGVGEALIPENAKLYLKRIGTGSGTLTADIETDNSNTPSGTQQCTSSTVDSAIDVGTTYGLINFTYSSSTCSLTANTKYWIVAKPSAGNGSTNYVAWGYLGAGGFTGGDMKQYTSGNWGGSLGDGGFELYKYTAPATPAEATSTATSTTMIIENPSQDIYNVLILFFVMFFGLLFYFKR